MKETGVWFFVVAFALLESANAVGAADDGHSRPITRCWTARMARTEGTRASAPHSSSQRWRWRETTPVDPDGLSREGLKGLKGLGVDPGDVTSGCASTDFVANVTIGGQTFSLIVDTGSSTLAVASEGCANCGGSVTPRYDTASGQSMQESTSASYGDGSGWSGTVYNDRVTVGGVETNLQFAAITSQSNGFFDIGDCQYDRPAPFQGILGLAYQALVSAGTQSFAAQVAKPFRVQMCDFVGELAFADTASVADLGADDGVFQSGEVLWLPVVQQTYYTVSASAFRVGNLTLNMGGANVIVDSGTTVTYLAHSLYSEMVAALNADPHWTALFGTSFWPAGSGSSPCIRQPTNVSSWMSALPEVEWTFPATLGSDTAVCQYAVRLSPLRSLVYPIISEQNGHTYFCPGVLSAGNGPQVLGWTFMNQFAAIFDQAGNRVGLAPNRHSPCDADLTGDTDAPVFTVPTLDVAPPELANGTTCRIPSASQAADHDAPQLEPLVFLLVGALLLLCFQ